MVIYCSKTLKKALNLEKEDMATTEQLDAEINALFAWHGHIAKIQGRQTIVLMNDETMYCMLFRNKLPRKGEKFKALVQEGIPYIFEVGNVNGVEIRRYMESMGEIVFAEKQDRQMTGNINRLVMDFDYSWEYTWNDEETIQAAESWRGNGMIRKKGKDHIVPFEEMFNGLDTLSEAEA